MTRPESFPAPSPMERHILDFLSRIEQVQGQERASLKARIAALEQGRTAMIAQIAAQEARIRDLEAGADASSNLLAGFLALPDWPPHSDG